MRYLNLSVGILILLGSFGPCALSKEKPSKSDQPLGGDEIAIYRTLLSEYASDDSGAMNVSSETEPLDLGSSASGLEREECLKGIQLNNLAIVSHTYHALTSDILPGKNMKLVDPFKQAKIVQKNDPSKTIRSGKSVDSAVREAFSTGLFTLSEIAFDKEHHFAAVTHSFWCGALCGHGATVIFEKVEGNWRKTARSCGGWVS
jgi:hypothetical protein